MYKACIVDDEIWALRSIECSFDWDKYNIEVAYSTTNPKEAIEWIKQNEPDVIFTDLKMPKISGIELIQTVKSLNIATEIVVISVLNDYKDIIKVVHLGIVDYLLKPIDDRITNDLLRRLVEKLDRNKEMKKLKAAVSEYNYKSQSVDNPHLEEIVNYIRDNYARDIFLSEIAEKFHLSEGYMSRLFKMNMDTTFCKYLNEVRVNEAQKLLILSNQSVREIALSVGYSDYSYFGRVFKKVTSETPKEFRERNKWINN